jgi:hypothetical protein
MKKNVLLIALSLLFGGLKAQIGEALNFDGTNDYVQISDPNLGTSDFTIETWIKPNSSNGGYVISNRTSECCSWGSWFSFGFNNQGAVTAELADGGFTYTTIATPNNLITAGSWSHIALVRSGLELSIYVDGVLQARQMEPGARNITSGSNIANLSGWVNYNVAYFGGSMDETRFWNVARTECELNIYKNSEITTTAAGLVGNYHFNQGLASGSNSGETILTDYSAASNNGNLINFNLTGTTSNWVSPGAVVTGNTTLSVCPTASALNFDGVNDFVTVPDQAALNFGTGDFTIEANFRSSVSQPNYAGIVAKAGSGANVGFQLVLYNNRIAAEISNGSTSFGVSNGLIGATVLTDGNWHHLAMVVTRSLNQVQLFVDGNVEATLINGAVSGLDVNSTSSLLIGVERTYGIKTNGNLDEVRLWNVARTRCDIISYQDCEIPTTATGLVTNFHFNQGFPADINTTVSTLYDAANSSMNGTLTNFALTGTTSNWISPGAVISGFSTPIVCPLASALNFDGNDDHINIGSIIPSGNSYTKELWVYASSNSCNNLVSSGDDPFYLSGGSLAAGNSGAYNYVQDPAQFPLNSWTHACVTYDAPTSTMKLYVNGTLVASGSASNAYTGNDIHIGRHPFGGCFFNGNLDDVRIWNVARTQCEINTYMNCEIPANAPGLLANYHFNQGIAQMSNPSETVLIDNSGNSHNSNLLNFNLTGSFSNWTAPGAVVSGYTTALAPPVVTVNSGSICAGQSFTMMPTGALTYTYSNGSSVAMPTADATYTVTGTDANGCENMATSSVTVNALPTVSVNNGTICAGQSFTMMPTGALTYTYSNGSNVAMPTADATYTVTGTDGNGCENMATSSVTVNALPTVSVNNGTICAGQSFTMVPTGALTYTYSNGSSVAMPTADATYTVTGTDANGCENMATSSVTVNALPVLSVTTSNTLMCTGQSVTLSVSGADTYTWSTNETSSSIVVAPTSQATYTVDGTDANGCSNTTTITQDVSLCTGIASNSPSSSLLNIYPNPNNGTFTVKSDTDMHLNLTNALGQVIQIIELNYSNNQETTVNVLANGVYFITGQNANQSVKQKVIVTK